MDNEITKVVRPGTIDRKSIFCKIRIKQKEKGLCLLITGVVGPRSNGDCVGSCGQIVMDWRGKYAHNPLVNFAPGWNQELFDKFLDIWNAWHLNDMRAGCEHQRAWHWTHCSGHYSKPGVDVDKANSDLRRDGVALVSGYGQHYYCTDDDAPVGGSKCTGSVYKLCTPCPICKYKYGSAWLFEALPQEVINFLMSLPDTDKQPAWC